MRFEFDREKSWDVKRKQGVSLKEAQESHLITAWIATKEEEQSYAENV